MNKVINACYRCYKIDSEDDQNPKLKEAISAECEFEEILKSKLPKDEARSLINELFAHKIRIQELLMEEYFEAGFNYGKTL